MRKHTRNGIAAALALLLGSLAATAHAADGVVGPGNCDEEGFADVLASVDGSGGGTITFDCASPNFSFTHYKTVANAVTVDGGGVVSIDGGGASAFFQSFASANLTLKGLTLAHGTFSEAHALENFGTLTLDHVSVLDGSSGSEPIFVNSGVAHIVASTFSGNSASTSAGGAFANTGTSATVDSSTFASNTAGTGGAIYSTADLSVVNSTFVSNTSVNGGGGIYQTQAGAATVSFSTFADNSSAFGAGVYNDGSGGSNSLTLAANLFHANTGGNCDGVLSSTGYNLSDDTHCGSALTGPGDENGVALTMEAFGNYGGPTRTLPPASGNPAIDHVPVAACSVGVDQRGGARPFGSACDTGAVEVGALVNDVIFANGFEFDPN
jgi:predicted outer membrane repeat protein